MNPIFFFLDSKFHNIYVKRSNFYSSSTYNKVVTFIRKKKKKKNEDRFTFYPFEVLILRSIEKLKYIKLNKKKI